MLVLLQCCSCHYVRFVILTERKDLSFPFLDASLRSSMTSACCHPDGSFSLHVADNDNSVHYFILRR